MSKYNFIKCDQTLLLRCVVVYILRDACTFVCESRTHMRIVSVFHRIANTTYSEFTLFVASEGCVYYKCIPHIHVYCIYVRHYNIYRDDITHDTCSISRENLSFI